MMKIKRIFTVIAVAAVTILCSCFSKTAGHFNDFDAFTKRVLKEHFEDDYLTAHYLLENPVSFGVRTPLPSLPTEADIGVESYARDLEYCQSVLDALESFDYASLTPKQKNEYTLIKDHFTNAAVLDSYPQYDFQWYPTIGVFDKTITNLSEFPIRNRKDADDHLKCLETAGDFFDAVIGLTEWQIEQGCFAEANIVRNETSKMRAFYNTDTSSLPIAKNYADMLSELGLSNDEAEKLISKQKELIDTVLKPAVKKSYQFLEEHINSIESEPVHNEEHKGYYTAYIRSLTGSTESLEELKEYFEKDLRKIAEKINEINADGVSTEGFGGTDISSEEILEMLRYHMEDYPKLDSADYEVINQSNSNTTVLAYYVSPPLDSHTADQIKVNSITESNPVLKYIVLAHEGFPGHCYQKNYFRKSEYYSDIAAVFENPSYIEGWAQYAELDMLQRLGLSEETIKYWILKEEFEYEMGAFADIVVNGLGWDWKELDTFIKGIGYKDPDSKVILAKSLVSSVKRSPGMYVPYGYGMLKFIELRQFTEEEQGADFNPVEFHKIILEHGSRSFARIRQDLIESFSK